MEITIRDKNIVISGGTKGVGRKMVQKCTEEGANVVFGGKDRERAKQILLETKENKGKALFVYTDIVNEADCKKLFDVAMDEFGRVDGFFNYAGITPVSSIDECAVEMLDEVMNINFRAAFICCKHAINCMRKNGGGSIIITGSPHAWGGDKDRAAYACSKGALLTLMNHISHNYGDEQIRCNYLTLGWTLTEGEIALRESQVKDINQYFQEAAKLIPMKRLCIPDDYVEQILYLFSDASKMMTGSVIHMSAGYFL